MIDNYCVSTDGRIDHEKKRQRKGNLYSGVQKCFQAASTSDVPDSNIPYSRTAATVSASNSSANQLWTAKTLDPQSNKTNCSGAVSNAFSSRSPAQSTFH